MGLLSFFSPLFRRFPVSPLTRFKGIGYPACLFGSQILPSLNELFPLCSPSIDDFARAFNIIIYVWFHVSYEFFYLGVITGGHRFWSLGNGSQGPTKVVSPK